MKSRLAITLGDPAGIGPEVILKALGDRRLSEQYDLTVVGTRSLLQDSYDHLLGCGVAPQTLARPQDLRILEVDGGGNLRDHIQRGQGNKASGELSFRYLQTAIDRTLKGEFAAIVTAPISKYCWQQAGHHYPGQTEVLAQAAQVNDFAMMFVGRSPITGWPLRTLLATTHIPLAQVSPSLSPALMDQKLGILLATLHQDFGLHHPTIAIAGLNPHSGEGGQLGQEEVQWLNGWLQAARKRYPQATLQGLFPPDTLWIGAAQAWYGHDQNHPAPDAYLALYHDQGLIPVKMLAFDYAINTTVGLPFIRTSPDHGTAFDLAPRGLARDTSMKEAIALAATMAQGKTPSQVPAKMAITTETR